MDKLKEAKQILSELGLPAAQQNERSALILLALCNMAPQEKWKNATKSSMAVVGNKRNPEYPGIMRFIAKHYKKQYAENSRETFRRQTLHQFVHAGIVEHNPENPQLATNSKLNHYRLSDAALSVVRTFGSRKYNAALETFRSTIGSLQEQYAQNRDLQKISVQLPDGTNFKFSPGKHNLLQKYIVEDFASRFAHGSKLLYVGDTADKNLIIDVPALNALGIPLTEHSKLPDVVLYDSKRQWLFLIEAVTSHGPVSPKRIREFQILFSKCPARPVYVSAFLDFHEFKKYIADIAWETEVWIVDHPEHMIHFNGDKFLGPH